MVQLLYEQFETRKQKIRRHKGTKIYRFENRNLVTTIENVGIPIVMGKQNVMSNTDIANDIPLLQSQKSM